MWVSEFDSLADETMIWGAPSLKHPHELCSLTLSGRPFKQNSTHAAIIDSSIVPSGPCV